MINENELVQVLSKNPICPISFIGNTAKPTPELNELFIAGYNLKKVSDDLRLETSNKISAKMDKKDRNNFEYALYRCDLNSVEEAIKSYLITNITDVTIRTLYDCTRNCFILPDKTPSANFISLNPDEIREIVKNKVSELIARFSAMPNNLEAISIIYSQFMDIMISYLIAYVFDRSVVATVDNIFLSNIHVAFYKACFAECYNCKESDVVDIPNDDGFIYTFVSGIIREKMLPYIVELRSALVLIANTAAHMKFNGAVNEYREKANSYSEFDF